MTLNQLLLLLSVLMVPAAGVLLALGLHSAVGKAFSLLDGHLERFQGKLDVMLEAQLEHNRKLDLILRKLF